MKTFFKKQIGKLKLVTFLTTPLAFSYLAIACNDEDTSYYLIKNQQDRLESIKKTSLSGMTFYTSAFLTSTPLEKGLPLGINITMPDTVRATFVKPRNSFTISYTLEEVANLNNRKTFEVTFEKSSADDKLLEVSKSLLDQTQSSMLIENDFLATTFKNLTWQEGQTKLGIPNFDWSNDLSISLSKDEGKMVTYDLKLPLGAIRTFVYFNDFSVDSSLNQVASELRKIHRTSLKSLTFYENSLDKTPLNDAEVTTMLGIKIDDQSGTFDQSVEVNVSKQKNSTLVSYELHGRDGQTLSFEHPFSESEADLVILETQATLLLANQSTSLIDFFQLKLDSKQFTKPSLASVITGLDYQTLNQTLLLNITKESSNKNLNYVIKYGLWASKNLTVEVTNSFGDEALLLALETNLKLLTHSDLTSRVWFENQTIASSDAMEVFGPLRIGISNYNPTWNKIVQLRGNAIIRFSKEPYSKRVKFEISMVGLMTSPRSFEVEFKTFGLDEAKVVLENIRDSKISEAGFNQVEILTNTILDDRIMAKLGMTRPRFLSDEITIRVAKARHSNAIYYAIASLTQKTSTNAASVFYNFATYDTTYIANLLKMTKQTNLSESEFQAWIIRDFSDVNNTLAISLGLDLDSVLSQVPQGLNLQLTKSRDEKITFQIIETTSKIVIEPPFEIVLTEFDYKIDDVLLIDGAAHNTLSARLFNNLSNDGDDEKIVSLQAILKVYFANGNNPFESGEFTNIKLYDFDHEKWNSSIGQYELDFGFKMTNNEAKFYRLKALNIVPFHEAVVANGQEYWNARFYRGQDGIVFLTNSLGLFQKTTQTTNEFIDLGFKNVNPNPGSVYHTSNHDLYVVGNDNKLYVQLSNETSFRQIPNLRVNNQSFLFENGQCLYLASADVGVYELNPKTGVFELMINSPVLAYESTRAQGFAFLTSQQVLYLASPDGDLFTINIINNKFERITRAPSLVGAQFFEDSLGQLWLINADGAYLFNDSYHQFELRFNQDLSFSLIEKLSSGQRFIITRDGKIYLWQTTSLELVHQLSSGIIIKDLVAIQPQVYLLIGEWEKSYFINQLVWRTI